MTRALLVALVCVAPACAFPPSGEPAPADHSGEDGEAATAAWLAAIPSSCLAHRGKEFLGLGVSCSGDQPKDTCGIDRAQKATPLDGSGNPVAWICNCFNDDVYSCTYVGEAVAQ